MSRCKHFIARDEYTQVNCGNCKLWENERCRDEVLILRAYTESAAFKTYDRMMRSNRGIQFK